MNTGPMRPTEEQSMAALEAVYEWQYRPEGHSLSFTAMLVSAYMKANVNGKLRIYKRWPQIAHALYLWEHGFHSGDDLFRHYGVGHFGTQGEKAKWEARKKRKALMNSKCESSKTRSKNP